MRRIALIVCFCVLLAAPACYREVPCVAAVDVQLVLRPDEPVSIDLTQLEVRLQNKNADFGYVKHPDASGRVRFEVQPGKYDVMAAGWFTGTRIAVNGASEEFLLTGTSLIDAKGQAREPLLEILLNVVVPNPVIIREAYFHGSSTLEGANYTKDTYIEIYNNAGPGGQTVWLDSLCLAAIYPYNSTTGNNAWAGRDTIPIAQMFWMFPGDGHTYPLLPGESAVVACIAAVDHRGRATSALPLNRAHFGCWSETLSRHEIAAGGADGALHDGPGQCLGAVDPQSGDRGVQAFDGCGGLAGAGGYLGGLRAGQEFGHEVLAYCERLDSRRGGVCRFTGRRDQAFAGHGGCVVCLDAFGALLGQMRDPQALFPGSGNRGVYGYEQFGC